MGILDFFNQGANAIAGTTGNYGNLLSDEERKAIDGQRRMALAASLLESAGPSTQRTSLTQALGRSMGAANQAGAAGLDQALQSALLKKQLAAVGQTNAPNSVREYEYAKQNGFKGSFQDWVVAGGQSSRPSAVQEWEFYDKLPKEQKLQYLEMKRNPGIDIKTIGGVPTAVDATRTGGVNSVQLSSLGSETAAANALKRAEAEGGAIGKGEGEIEAGIQKKGSDAVSVKSTIDQAREYIPQATGSPGGAAYDAALAQFGSATEGSKAIARLKVLQANLMTQMPRMEGPQSDRDVDLYREAAGKIGDPTVPREIKMEALDTMEEINNRYQERATGKPATKAPKRVRVDAQGNVIK